MEAEFLAAKGVSSTPKYFLSPSVVLLQSGAILSGFDIETSTQTHLLTLSNFESITAISTNPNANQQLLAIAIQGFHPRIEIYHFNSAENTLELIIDWDQCCDVGYSFLDISDDGQYLIALSKSPHLQVEYWNIEERSKLASSDITDDIHLAAFSPIGNDVFMTCNAYFVTFWRVYFKFDQYFLTSMKHRIDNSEKHAKREITNATWGAAGQEIIYATNRGEIASFQCVAASEPPALQHTTASRKDIFRVFFSKAFFVVALAEGGILQFIDKSTGEKCFQWTIDSDIREIEYLPNYKGFLITTVDWKLYQAIVDPRLWFADYKFLESERDMAVQSTQLFRFSKADQLSTHTSMAPLRVNNSVLLECGELELLQLSNQMSQINDGNDTFFPINGVSTITVFHYSNIDLIALGFADGKVALAHTDNGSELKIIYAERLFTHSITQLSFDMNGDILAAMSAEEKKVWFINIEKRREYGYITLKKPATCCAWILDAISSLKLIVALSNGVVVTYDAPEIDVFPKTSDMSLTIYSVDCEVDYALHGVVRDPSQSAPDRLLCITEDRRVRAFLLDDDATVFPDDSFPVKHTLYSINQRTFRML